MPKMEYRVCSDLPKGIGTPPFLTRGQEGQALYVSVRSIGFYLNCFGPSDQVAFRLRRDGREWRVNPVELGADHGGILGFKSEHLEYLVIPVADAECQLESAQAIGPLLSCTAKKDFTRQDLKSAVGFAGPVVVMSNHDTGLAQLVVPNQPRMDQEVDTWVSVFESKQSEKATRIAAQLCQLSPAGRREMQHVSRWADRVNHSMQTTALCADAAGVGVDEAVSSRKEPPAKPVHLMAPAPKVKVAAKKPKSAPKAKIAVKRPSVWYGRLFVAAAVAGAAVLVGTRSEAPSKKL